MCFGLFNRIVIKGFPLAVVLLFQDAEAARLVDLIGEVSTTNPEVLAARMQFQAAESEVETARWQFFPTPSFSVRSALVDSDDAVNSTPSPVFGIEQPLWTGGRLSAGLESTVAVREASRAMLNETRQTLAIRLVQAYTDWYVARYKEQAVRDSLGTHRALLSQIDRRISEGLAARSDRTQVRSRIEQIEADVQAYVGQSRRGLSAIQQLIGRELQDQDLMRMVAAPLPLGISSETLRRGALLVSPSLQRARAAVQEAEASLKMAKAVLLPRVSLSFEHQWNTQYDIQPDSNQRIYLAITSDLGAGLSARSKKSAAAALAASAVRQLDVVQLNLIDQLESDRLSLLSMRARESFLDASISSAEAVRASYVRQYLQGRRTWLDVMNSEREVSQLKVQRVEVMGNQLLSSWRLGILTKGLEGLNRLVHD